MTEYTCRDCKQPLTKIHPRAPYPIAWGHTNIHDARDCKRPPEREWPVPVEEE